MVGKSTFRLNFIPLIFSLVIFSITVLAWYLINKSAKEQDQQRFEHFSLQVEHEIETRMEIYISVLSQTKNMFYATEEVDRKEFKEYVNQLDMLLKYPGIQGVGYTDSRRKKYQRLGTGTLHYRKNC